MKRGGVIGLLVAAAWVSPLFGQDDDLARVRSRYDAATLTELETVIAAAEADGVPRAALVEKAVEGAAKSMSGQVVLNAVRVWADELRVAVRLLGRGVDPGGLAKAAESIAHGVDTEVVRKLAGDYPADYPIMLQTIEDLAHAGVHLDQAQSMVTDAAERGLRGEEMLTISATLRRLVREGSSPVDAAASIRTNMRTGRVIPAPTSAHGSAVPRWWGYGTNDSPNAASIHDGRRGFLRAVVRDRFLPGNWLQRQSRSYTLRRPGTNVFGRER